MEIWQYSLMALVSVIGIFLGFFIGKATLSEVTYAYHYLVFFCGLSLLLGIAGLIYGISSQAEYIIPGFTFLFLGLLTAGSLAAQRHHK